MAGRPWRENRGGKKLRESRGGKGREKGGTSWREAREKGGIGEGTVFIH